jgi:hypothetical protein
MDLKKLRDTPPWEWPPGSDKIPLNVLKNERAVSADRLLAAELAGNIVVMNDEMAATLLSIAANSKESDQLRGQAAISLGPALEMADANDFEIEDDSPISEDVFLKIKTALRKIFEDPTVPKLVRRKVLEGAIRASEPWHIDAIREAFGNQDRDWKLTAVFGMQYVRGFDAEILEALHSGDEEVQLEAVIAAGFEEVDAAWDHVVELVNSPGTKKDLRIAAIQSMADIRPEEARRRLYELAESSDQDIADAADEAIMTSGTAHEFDEDEFLNERPGKNWIN